MDVGTQARVDLGGDLCQPGFKDRQLRCRQVGDCLSHSLKQVVLDLQAQVCPLVPQCLHRKNELACIRRQFGHGLSERVYPAASGTRSGLADFLQGIGKTFIRNDGVLMGFQKSALSVGFTLRCCLYFLLRVLNLLGPLNTGFVGGLNITGELVVFLSQFVQVLHGLAVCKVCFGDVEAGGVFIKLGVDKVLAGPGDR